MVEPPTRWYYEYITTNLFLASHLSRILYVGNTRYQRVEIIETVPFGRCLILDGRTQSSEADEFIYHEALSHPGLTSLPNPRSVFIAGGGEGATLREVMSYSTVEQVVMVDLDQEVVELCQEYLPNHHQGAFHDPRLTMIYDDAARHLETHPERYDLLVVDIPDPLEGGSAYLMYTREFYRLASQRLNPGGMIVTHAGPCSTINYHEGFTAIHRTISSIFPTVAPYRTYVPSFGSEWGFFLAGEHVEPTSLTPEEIDARLTTRVTKPLRFYDGITHRSMFALPKYLREALAKEDRLITHDNPLYAI